MSEFVVRPLRGADVEDVVRMRMLLFPDCEAAQQRLELSQYESPTANGVGATACFVCEQDKRLIGFAETMIRSHAEGCWDETWRGALGVGYLEAWWVDENQRHRGAGRALVAACETWARANGCTVFASDAEIDNIDSQRAHEALGFREVERAVHYVKPL